MRTSFFCRLASRPGKRHDDDERQLWGNEKHQPHHPDSKKKHVGELTKKAEQRDLGRRTKWLGLSLVCGTILVVFLNTIRVKLDDNEFRAFHKRLINEPCCHSANLAFYKTCNTVFENFSAALPSRNDGSFLHKISTGIAKLTTSETAKNSLLDQENALLRDCPGFGIKRYDADVDDAEALGRLLEMAVLPPSDFDSMRKEHLWDGVASRWQKAVRKKTPTNVVDTLRVLLRSRTASLGREPYLPFMTT